MSGRPTHSNGWTLLLLRCQLRQHNVIVSRMLCSKHYAPFRGAGWPPRHCCLAAAAAAAAAGRALACTVGRRGVELDASTLPLHPSRGTALCLGAAGPRQSGRLVSHSLSPLSPGWPCRCWRIAVALHHRCSMQLLQHLQLLHNWREGWQEWRGPGEATTTRGLDKSVS